MRSHRLWVALPLFVVLCACSRVGGCAAWQRDAVNPDRPPTGTIGPPSRAVSPRAGNGAKTAVLPPARSETGGTVNLIRDGDSFVVLRDGVDVEVRLDGIDCPELDQAFGRKAKSFTSALAFGKTVRLAVKGLDRYDRELAEVFLPDGRSLNRELVAAGFAWWFRRYSSDESLEILEREARTARRGLWADPDPVPPWDFRERGEVRPTRRR